VGIACVAADALSGGEEDSSADADAPGLRPALHFLLDLLCVVGGQSQELQARVWAALLTPFAAAPTEGGGGATSAHTATSTVGALVLTMLAEEESRARTSGSGDGSTSGALDAALASTPLFALLRTTVRCIRVAQSDLHLCLAAVLRVCSGEHPYLVRHGLGMLLGLAGQQVNRRHGDLVATAKLPSELKRQLVDVVSPPQGTTAARPTANAVRGVIAAAAGYFV
jgi:hypothetical protein